ncbi:MAG TPA: DUF6265 family protein [Vicinamibacteria bacterium]|nr:DUF6265 family protein [Vicinamibacteria bacterium]
MLFCVNWLILVSALVAATQTGPSSEVESLGFLTGSWLYQSGGVEIEEHWTPVKGGTLFGVSRTVVEGRTVAFEYLRIESRGEGIFYVAQPNGRPGTDFELTRFDASTAVFENPQHDHPKIIRYEKHPDGTLLARIQGEEGSEHREQEFRFRPVPHP